MEKLNWAKIIKYSVSIAVVLAVLTFLLRPSCTIEYPQIVDCNNYFACGTAQNGTMYCEKPYEMTVPVVFIYSTTCPHCARMMPIVHSLSNYNIEWLAAENYSGQYGELEGVPAFVLGTHKIYGEQTAQDLINWIQEYAD